MMKPEIKKRWVEALRSGEYQQAKDYLVSLEGYCCLGVLCEIAVQDGVVYREGDEYISTSEGFDVNNVDLPVAVQRWAGVEDAYDGGFTSLRSNVPYKNTDRNADFTELNDEMDYTFKMIADAIENDPNL